MGEVESVRVVDDVAAGSKMLQDPQCVTARCRQLLLLAILESILTVVLLQVLCRRRWTGGIYSCCIACTCNYMLLGYA
jgi:hypothetical protein